MKAHKTTLSVRELQKTIGQWKSWKITDSTVSKLLGQAEGTLHLRCR